MLLGGCPAPCRVARGGRRIDLLALMGAGRILTKIRSYSTKVAGQPSRSPRISCASLFPRVFGLAVFPGQSEEGSSGRYVRPLTQKEATMRKLIFFVALFAVTILGTPLFSQNCTSQAIGNTTFTNCSDGSSSTSQRIGTTTFHNFSDGTSGTSQQIGNTTFHNFSTGVSGTSQRVGTTTFHNYSNGISGTSQRAGNTTFHNFSNGRTATSQRIGSTTFYNGH